MSRASEFEEMFASRFSAADEEFQRYRERPPDTPPVLEDYRVNRGRGDRRGPEQRQHHDRYQRHDQYQHQRYHQDQYQYHQRGSGGRRPQY